MNLAILNLLIWFGFSVDCFLVTNLGVNVIQDYFFFLLQILQSKHFCHHVILACLVINALQSYKDCRLISPEQPDWMPLALNKSRPGTSSGPFQPGLFCDSTLVRLFLHSSVAHFWKPVGWFFLQAGRGYWYAIQTFSKQMLLYIFSTIILPYNYVYYIVCIHFYKYICVYKNIYCIHKMVHFWLLTLGWYI